MRLQPLGQAAFHIRYQQAPGRGSNERAIQPQLRPLIVPPKYVLSTSSPSPRHGRPRPAESPTPSATPPGPSKAVQATTSQLREPSPLHVSSGYLQAPPGPSRASAARPRGLPPLTTSRGGQATSAAPIAPQGLIRRCSPLSLPAIGRRPRPRSTARVLAAPQLSWAPLTATSRARRPGPHCHCRRAEVQPATHTIRRCKDLARPPPPATRGPASVATPRQPQPEGSPSKARAPQALLSSATTQASPLWRAGVPPPCCFWARTAELQETRPAS
ncbi:hypothetical protein NDU88_011080 [Pleurodeles waltl]|uniref:Uncharacterized protein n=1 Tax=Pleurodeles waltl TaxID=8319 RepID=A0AAV7R2D3_PLEWA|nr:hypothetical protein NDU88_011080 [Pleurodeles waltl]